MSLDSTSSSRRLRSPHSQPSGKPGLTFDPSYVNKVSRNGRTADSPGSLTAGTGYSIYHNTIIPAIRSAQREVVLVTCFWAASATRDDLAGVLRDLSQKALSVSSRIHVQICFSSSSLVQSLLSPTPRNGQTYSPEEWKTKLGLPGAAELEGLDLQVKRKFFWPWGIWHSKYVIIDRELAIFPSCNVSWERWFEVAVPIRGTTIGHLTTLHTEWWSTDALPVDTSPSSSTNGNATGSSMSPSVHATLLPSPHRPSLLPQWLRPRALIGLLPCIRATPTAFPLTPLLSTTHHLLSTAQRSITMVTPNITEPHVIALLTSALERGTDVFLYTNRTLMTLEQIITAGSTTPSCMVILKRRHLRMPERSRGYLEVLFFDDLAAKMQRIRAGTHQQTAAAKEMTATKLHAKVTIVDGERILFGSGNMDAASWQTSQELGVLVESKEVVEQFMGIWDLELARVRRNSVV